ncbi:MAG TPA: pre-toxin TG domain-containing protein, partial [Candidatus Angelobacter sp.]|nr:pre-toxin TG domain-containing protein [Candidatus Angelobacter sp.]
KDLAGRAWNTIKGWAGTAWSAIKSAAGRVWDGVKWLGGKAWDFAKWMGSKAVALAKTLGLDKAWNWIKKAGSAALKYAGKAYDYLKKKLGPVLDVVKKVGEYVAKAAVILNPAMWPLGVVWAGCKTLACLMPRLMSQGSTSQKATDLATDLTPVVSTVKDGCGCITGQNMITGEEIGTGERAVRCTVAVIDIAGYVAGFFTEGAAAAGEQAAKGVIRAWLERLFKIGGKELAEKGSEAIVKGFAKLSEKELAEALAKMGEKELKELAEQAAKSGEKDLAQKVEKQLTKRIEAIEQGAKEIADEGLKAKVPTADGGEIKITKNGKFFVCASPCEEFYTKYGKVLEANEELLEKFRKIETEISDAEEQAKALSALKIEVEAAAKVSDPLRTAANFGLEGANDHGGLIIGRLSNGAEVAVTFSKAGDSLAVNVVAVFNPSKTDVLGSLLRLYKGAFRAAKAEGVANVTIRAAAVVNKDLEAKLVQEGWQLTKVKVGEEIVDAFERTFPVK